MVIRSSLHNLKSSCPFFFFLIERFKSYSILCFRFIFCCFWVSNIFICSVSLSGYLESIYSLSIVGLLSSSTTNRSSSNFFNVFKWGRTELNSWLNLFILFFPLDEREFSLTECSYLSILFGVSTLKFSSVAAVIRFSPFNSLLSCQISFFYGVFIFIAQSRDFSFMRSLYKSWVSLKYDTSFRYCSIVQNFL